MALPDIVNVSVGEGLVKVVPLEKSIHGRSIWGTVRANINNMVVGVSKGFARNLEINGVGYRAAMQGNKLQLNLGFSWSSSGYREVKLVRRRDCNVYE